MCIQSTTAVEDEPEKKQSSAASSQQFNADDLDCAEEDDCKTRESIPLFDDSLETKGHYLQSLSAFEDYSQFWTADNCNEAMLESRHTLLKNLMKDVYEMFNPNWGADAQTCANPPSGSSETQGHSRLKLGSSPVARKRQSNDRDQERPDKEKRKRGRGAQSDAGSPGDFKCRLFACPFHKYDPHKYSVNDETLAKYRTCTGPGFPFISRLK